MIEIPSWLVLASASYFAFTAGSILLILYKTATSGWRVRWRLRKLGQSQIEFPLTKRLHREANKVRLVLVHGTWALRGDWHKPESAYLEELARRIDELCPDVEVDVYRFLWSGGNTVTDRARAIARLASAECWGSEVPIIVVAHSHGGNIVVNVLDENPALASSVQSIITVATPFLVSRRRPMALAVPLAIVSAALSACGLTAGAVPLLQSSLGSTNEQVYAIAGLLALLLFGCIFWQAGRIRASVNGGLPDDRILKKLLVVRASGDEAGATLGTGYILGYAVRVAARILAGIATAPVRGFETLVRGESDNRANVGLEILQFVLGLALFGIAAWLVRYAASDWVKWPVILLGLLGIWSTGAIVVVWGGRLARHIITIGIHGLFETLLAVVLLPFGPETAIASPLVIVSAEAVPPGRGRVNDRVPVILIPFKEGAVMQHSFERHAKDIAEITAHEIQRHCSKDSEPDDASYAAAPALSRSAFG